MERCIHFVSLCLPGKSCFSPLFTFEEMQEIVKSFTLIHIDAPGQEEGSAVYPAGYVCVLSVPILIILRNNLLYIRVEILDLHLSISSALGT